MKDINAGAYIKKNIFILMLLLIVIGALFAVRSYIYKGNTGALAFYVDGVKTKEYSLFEDGEYRIESVYGTNYLCINAGSAYVKNSDCKDKTCEKMGTISQPGQSIICLPHHLMLIIEGEGEFDGISG